MLTKIDNRLIYRWDAEQLWIEPWGKDSLRIRATKMPSMPQDDWALLPPKPCEAVVELSERGGSVTNGNIIAKITATGKITFLDASGKKLLEEYVRNRKGFQHAHESSDRNVFASALNLEARELCPIIGGDYSLTARFEPNEGERLYGMGQYQQPYLELKGSELELAHRNSQASVPFVLSSIGYGMLWNNPAIGRVVFGKGGTTWTARSTKALDYWITAAQTPAAIMEAYGCATGFVPMMPDYVMGLWQCKLRYQTQDELMEVAREYKRRGLPISVIVVDYFHWPRQGEWKFDTDYWPNPDGMVSELREMGIELMVSVWPTVDYKSENFPEMQENGYLVRTERGFRICMDYLGNTVHFDATNPEAQKYVWGKVKKNYYDKGIRIFWLDEAEPEYTEYDFDHYRYHLGSDMQIGNLYPMLYAKAFYDGMVGEGQQNVLNLIRCAWAGSQRYGTLVWSGDIHSSFRSLREQLTAGLNMGLAGIPWWTTDIGGFHGGNPDNEEFRELFVRWFQYATFCPIMRLHGYRDPQTPPIGDSGGGCCDSGAANEVWSYGETVYAICEKYILLREKIKGYIIELMESAHLKGAPVIRPLFFDFPQDAYAWEIEDAYMFGPDMLVAPILSAGQTSRMVYLPTGAHWKNYHTGEEFDGGHIIEADAPIDVIPVFLRDNREL